MKKSSQKVLDAGLVSLRDEHELLTQDAPDCVGAVMRRLGEIGEVHDQDEWLLAPEADPRLEGQPVSIWLRQEAELGESGMDWQRFQEQIGSRLRENAIEDGVDPLMQRDVPVSLGELLREAHAEAVREAPGDWSHFREQVVGRATSRGAGVAGWAVRKLREEVQTAATRDAAIFDGPFRASVEDRVRAIQPGADSSGWFHQLGAWAGTQVRRWRVGVVGLAASAALVGLAVNLGDREPSKMQAALSGEVSVDAVDFEGDVVMIPEDGITVVVLSGV